jgi:ABC-type Fe3+ transport system permease subunit
MWATSSGLILESLLFAILVGMLATMAAVMAIRSALESSFTTRLLLVFAMLLLTVPAPVLGFGVKGAIDWLLDLEELIFGRSEFLPLRAMLYDLPSPLPVLWCQTVKFFPYAVAILLPLMKSIPREILEEFRLMGSSRWSEFRLFWWPTLRKSMVYAVLLIALFAMSEISASKLVEVPGRVTFAHELFRQMHYGANDTVAAFCLVQVALSIIVAMVMLRISNR